MPGKIFISYRRDDDPAFAARVRDGLAAKFGKSALFMDVDNLLAGQKFSKELAKALDSCDVLVAIIGSRWADILSARRAPADNGRDWESVEPHLAAEARDYVREEIGAALKRGIVRHTLDLLRSTRPCPRPNLLAICRPERHFQTTRRHC